MSERIKADSAQPADSGRVDLLNGEMLQAGADALERFVVWESSNDEERYACVEAVWRAMQERTPTPALAAQGQGAADLAGYVDPEQVADMQRNGGGVLIGSFSERYGRTVPVYFHPAPAPAPAASPAGVPNALRVWAMAEGAPAGDPMYEAARGHVREMLKAAPSAPASPAGVPDQVRFAINRCIDSQEAFAERIDTANAGDPYASLMVRNDINYLRDWLAAAPSAPESNT